MPEKNYTTEKKEEIRTLDRTGQLLTIIRVWATTRKGTYYHVDVPESEIAAADKMLTAKATQLDAI